MGKQEFRRKILNQTELQPDFNEIKEQIHLEKYIKEKEEPKSKHSFSIRFKIIIPVMIAIFLLAGIGMTIFISNNRNRTVGRKLVYNTYESYADLIGAEKALQKKNFEEPELFLFDVAITGVKDYKYVIQGVDYCDHYHHKYDEYCPNMRYRALSIRATFDEDGVIDENFYRPVSNGFGIFFTCKTSSDLTNLVWMTSSYYYNTNRMNGYKYSHYQEEYALKDPSDPENQYIVIVGFNNVTEEQKNLVLNYVKGQLER
ncbi:MAG: hypothetical protein K2J93_05850 [Anaeroplasmataceae bacterium]|nr:hypothetical protein [Anaeroplasmataceae bacterium]